MIAQIHIIIIIIKRKKRKKREKRKKKIVVVMVMKNLLSTSLTLCCRICCSVLGFSSSFMTFPMTVSASSFCCLCLTCPSYRTHESRTCLASCTRAVRCSSSNTSASRRAVSWRKNIYKRLPLTLHCFSSRPQGECAIP